MNEVELGLRLCGQIRDKTGLSDNDVSCAYGHGEERRHELVMQVWSVRGLNPKDGGTFPGQ